MNTVVLRHLRRWRIPAASGMLIAIAFAVRWIAGGAADIAVTPAWWIGAADTHASAAFTLGDAFMLAGAATAGARIVLTAVRSLIARVVSIDLLVSVAAVGAAVIGNLWEAAAVTFLFAVGHTLQAATLAKTRSALAGLVAIAPDTAVVLRDGRQHTVPAGAVRPGEIVVVKDGAKIPVDGEVISGTGAVDEASITGESLPAEKVAHDRVFAGTVSLGGLLQVRVSEVGADTTLARIIRRVEQAQDAKARTQAFMDRFSRWYTPGVILLALAAGLISGDIVLALTLLVIGCPGALVVSIPVAIVAGVGRAARDGILIKGGDYLETSARLTAVAVDKTGTLTQGRPQLTDVVALDPDATRAEVLRWAALAESGSAHPLARAVIEAAEHEGLGVPGVPPQVTSVAGKGIVAQTDVHRVLVGTARLLADYQVPDDAGRGALAAQSLAAAGKTPMIVAVDAQTIGVIAVADRIRPDAADMVAQLRRAGIKKVVMLTGDTLPVAEAVGRAVGVDEVHAALLPEDKENAVARLQHGGHVTAMVGDGVNDAPALATADIGVAMGAAGSAVAVETADIALMGDALAKLPEAIWLARRTTTVMRQNIVIAVATVVLLLAGVFVGGVTMAVGMLVHEVSVLVVIANAMRLLRRHRTPLLRGGLPMPVRRAQTAAAYDPAPDPQPADQGDIPPASASATAQRTG